MIAVPYLVGVVTAPLVVAVLKPVLRGTVKASVGIGLQVKKAAAEACEDMQVAAAEVRAQAKKEAQST